MEITHQFVSAKSDGADATLVQPGDWNDTHVVAFRGARVKRSTGSGQTINNATQTTLLWDAEEYDTNSLHDTVTNNSRIVLNKVGYWHAILQVGLDWTSAPENIQAFIFRNGGGSEVAWSGNNTPDMTLTTTSNINISVVILATAITDYITAAVRQDSGASALLSPDRSDSFFSAHYLGA